MVQIELSIPVACERAALRESASGV